VAESSVVLPPLVQRSRIMHKFEVGQTVRFEPNTWYYRNSVAGPYEVRRQLPERNGEFEYCVKSSNEAHERVATESQIR
jgi:hypothetical protein